MRRSDKRLAAKQCRTGGVCVECLACLVWYGWVSLGTCTVQDVHDPLALVRYRGIIQPGRGTAWAVDGGEQGVAHDGASDQQSYRLGLRHENVHIVQYINGDVGASSIADLAGVCLCYAVEQEYLHLDMVSQTSSLPEAGQPG